MVIHYTVKWSNIQQFNAATIRDLKEDSTEDIVKTAQRKMYNQNISTL
jgi:hypothetical protein